MKRSDQPRYNRCDQCGRNAHKVAVRERVYERTDTLNTVTMSYYRPTGRTQVVGYCTSCFAHEIDHGRTFEKTPVLYDIRGAHARKTHPVPTWEAQLQHVLDTAEVTYAPNGRRSWATCGHPAELDINNHCYTCHEPVAERSNA